MVLIENTKKYYDIYYILLPVCGVAMAVGGMWKY
jgi:hypothetical protein